MTEYTFTQDWFSHNIPVWEQLIPLLPERDPEVGRWFIEIGSFEGRSMVWMAENMMEAGDDLTCIDTWGGSEEHSAETVQGIEDRFDHNLAVIRDKFPDHIFSKIKEKSFLALARDITYGDLHAADFIYIDGSHTAKDVLTDACMAWPLLKQGGLMVFDDYLWGESRDILHRPRLAVDFFVNIFAESLDIVHIGYQYAVRKK
jgi:cephalosporin hydroxylase